MPGSSRVRRRAKVLLSFQRSRLSSSCDVVESNHLPEGHRVTAG
jgi:hypothetical protein